MAKQQLSESQVLGLIARLEAGRTLLASGFELDSDARQAATDLLSWMMPLAKDLLCRLAPTLRDHISTAELQAPLWMFLQTVSLKRYLEYRRDKLAAGDKPLSIRQYLFNRRSQLKNFFRQLALKNVDFGYGESVRTAWQDVQTTARQLNRFLHNGRVIEYERVAVGPPGETWAALIPWQPRNTSRPYKDRRFLPFSARVTHSPLELSPASFECEARLYDGSSRARSSALVHSNERRLAAEPGGYTLTEYSISTGTRHRPPTFSQWLDGIFASLQEPVFPLRGTTILALRRARLDSIAVDDAFSDTYGGQR